MSDIVIKMDPSIGPKSGALLPHQAEELDRKDAARKAFLDEWCAKDLELRRMQKAKQLASQQRRAKAVQP